MSDSDTSDGQEQAQPVDAPPDSEQPQGDQKRLNGLQKVLGKRTNERDAALAQIEAMREQLAQYELTAGEPGKSQIELVYPERFVTESDDAGADEEERDPMLPPEPPVIYMNVSPARGQSMPLGEAPVVGNPLSPSVRYQQDQAQIAAMRRQLNAAGQQWVDQARESGLMPD